MIETYPDTKYTLIVALVQSSIENSSKTVTKFQVINEDIFLPYVLPDLNPSTL